VIAGHDLKAPAIVCVDTGETQSYGLLDHRAGKLAGALEARGVGDGDRVAIAALGRPEVFELQLACARLGAAMVPLNWRLASAEMTAVLADCGAAALITDPEVTAPAFPGPTLAIGDRLERALESAPSIAERRPPADELAQILYTSGTTGRPKGAMIGWRQVRFNAEVTAEMVGLGPDSAVLAMLPTFHTGGLNCLALPTLAAGGAVYLARRFDPARDAELLASGRIDATVAVPAMYQALLDAGLDALGRRDLELLCGGAPLPARLAGRYARLGAPLRQGFGMTEVGPNCFDGGKTGFDIGRPSPGTEARLVEPIDGVGELQLRGPHVCAGYWSNPAATREAFAEGGWFRTGDLASVDERGRYRIRGRKKDMYISGGENVYPAEVELALAAHPEVAEVAVVAVADERWGEVGLAAVALRPGSAIEIGDLDQWARGRLAGYKRPRHYLICDALPRTATGKVAKPELTRKVFAR
jgi:fatty-acyl-CoA synthase